MDNAEESEQLPSSSAATFTAFKRLSDMTRQEMTKNTTWQIKAQLHWQIVASKLMETRMRLESLA